VGEEALKNLDDSGIIRLGAEVQQGDILVGKITPKGETQLSPEEKLLRAIFGEKAGDVKDTSLRVPPGVEGIVIDAKIFSRRGVEKDERTKTIEAAEKLAMEKNKNDEIRIIGESVRSRLETLLAGKACSAPLKKGKKIYLEKNSTIKAGSLAEIPVANLEGLLFEDPAMTESVHQVLDAYREQVERCQDEFEARMGRYERGDELPPGVIKMVKVYVAMKRKLSVGDKMAGRHGNKGVVSRILPIEDMPYFARWQPRGHGAQSARRAIAHERRPDSGDSSGSGSQRAWRPAQRPFRGKQTQDLRQKLGRIFTDDAGDLEQMSDDGNLQSRGILPQRGAHGDTGFRRCQGGGNQKPAGGGGLKPHRADNAL
jgi:DNA-directed RNA polymerase subunit beta